MQRAFYCPLCGLALRVHPRCLRAIYVISAALVGIGAYALDFRGYGHLSVTVVALLPAYAVALFISVSLFPCDLEATGGYAAKYYNLDHDHTEREVFGPFHHPAETSLAERIPTIAKGMREPRFDQITPPKTIDSFLLKAGIALLAVYTAYSAATAIFYRIRPDKIETLEGSSGFDIRAELGQDGIAFTNLTGEQWYCNAAFGSWGQRYGASFQLPQGETRIVRYEEFQSTSARARPIALRMIAREGILADCSDTASGLSHLGDIH